MHQVFAMDTCFHNSIVGTYPYDVRCEILVELGFDAIYVSLQDGLHYADEMVATKKQYGFEVVAAYAGLVLSRTILKIMRFFRAVSTVAAWL